MNRECKNILDFIDRSRHFRQTGSTTMCAKIASEIPDAVLVVPNSYSKKEIEQIYGVHCINIQDENALRGRSGLTLVYDKCTVEYISDVLCDEVDSIYREKQKKVQEMGRMEEYICSLKAEIYKKDHEIIGLKERILCGDTDLKNAQCKIARLQETLTKIEKNIKEREGDFKINENK